MTDPNPNDTPLFVSDIINTPPDTYVLARDIADFHGLEVEKIWLHLRQRELGKTALYGLEAMGVSDAAILTERLEELDPRDHPMRADMFAVAATFNNQEGQEAKRLSTVARAVAFMATAQAVLSNPVKPAHPRHAELMIGYAQQMVEFAREQVPEATFEALSVLLDDFTTVDGDPSLG